MHRIERGNSDYPMVILDRLGDTSPCCLYAMGDVSLLGNCMLGLICSIQCPGSIVLKTFDAIRALRDMGVVVCGGFHSPMERECLDILLRSDQPVILCAAKGLPSLRLGREARRAVGENRLLVVSPFDDGVRRTTSMQAIERNKIVAAISEVLLVPYATPKGKAWTTISSACERGQVVWTLSDAENAALVDAGVKPMKVVDIPRQLISDTECPILKRRIER